MQKSDYIYMIADNAMIFGINLPNELQGNKFNSYLNKFDDYILSVIAGFNKTFLEHFIIIAKGNDKKGLDLILKKMEKIASFIGPTGSLNYLSNNQVELILTKLNSLSLNEITQDKIASIADERLQQQFSSSSYTQTHQIENQLSTAAFYLIEMGFPQHEIQEMINQARNDPSRIDSLFNIARRDDMPLSTAPSASPGSSASSYSSQSSSEPVAIESSPDMEKAIGDYVQQVQHEQPPERANKVAVLLGKIKDHVKELMTDYYEQVFQQIHPDRLNRALKMLKESKKKSKKIPLLLEWFFCSHLLENIEFKVEHWQVSSHATQGRAGVYSAGISFSRYDQIVKGFNEGKLSRVVNIMRRILQTPSKRAIQKLGQDLVAETGFDEHLYFTD